MWLWTSLTVYEQGVDCVREYSVDGMLNEATVEEASSSLRSTLEVSLGITASKRTETQELEKRRWRRK